VANLFRSSVAEIIAADHDVKLAEFVGEHPASRS
jgi:hypothetical protein